MEEPLNECCKRVLEKERAARKEAWERGQNKKEWLISVLFALLIPFMLLTGSPPPHPLFAAFFWLLAGLCWLNLFLKLKKHMKQRADKSPPA